jgi:hypothetical protein
MAIAILNPQGFSELSKYSGNPFLDAMVDLQGLFTTLATYQKAKPYIDRYSDTSLSDLKDKIKTYLPEALNDDGSINFTKLEELASKGNKLAETVLGIKQTRESFANASVGEKLKTLYDKDVADKMAPILSGELLTKQATVLKRMQDVEEQIKKLNLPKPVETFLLLNKEKIADNPEVLTAVLTAVLPFFMLQQDQNQTDTDNTQEENTFSAPAMRSIASIFDEKTNSILQSLTPNITQTNTSSSSNTEKKKQVVNKLKQYVNKKKQSKQNNQQQNQQQSQQDNSNSGIIFPWQNTSLPLLPWDNLLPKTTKIW